MPFRTNDLIDNQVAAHTREAPVTSWGGNIDTHTSTAQTRNAEFGTHEVDIPNHRGRNHLRTHRRLRTPAVDTGWDTASRSLQTSCGEGDSFSITSPAANCMEACYEDTGSTRLGHAIYTPSGIYSWPQSVLRASNTSLMREYTEVRLGVC